MQVPLKIAFRDVSPYEEVIGEEIRKWADKLEEYFPDIISCRVSVEKPHKHHADGNLYKATITLNVPDKQIVVSREHAMHHSHTDIFVAVHDAFKDVSRRLEEYAVMRYRDLKDHDLLPHGVVLKLFEEGYGFIQTFGGREIYFHKNSVLDGFDKLKTGMEVRFEEEQGEKGPQASTVKILRKQHIHHRRH